MAIGSKRSSAGARRACGPEIEATPRATSRTSRRHRQTGSTHSRPVVDGEVVALDEAGRPSFALLQARAGFQQRRDVTVPIVYQVFDLLFVDGESLLDVPLDDRKVRLRAVLRDHPLVRYAGHIEADGESLFASVQAEGLEGIMAKRRSSRYEPGRRSHAWLKIKQPARAGVRRRRLGAGQRRASGPGLARAGRLRRRGSSAVRGRGRQRARRSDAPRHQSPAWPPSAARPAPSTLRLDCRASIGSSPSSWSASSSPSGPRDELIRQAAYRGIEPEKDPRSVRRERPTRPTEWTADRRRQRLGTRPRRRPTTRRPRCPTERRRRAIRQPRRRRPRCLDQRPAADEPAQSASPDELAALDAMGAAGTWSIGGHEVGADQPRQGHLPGRRVDQARPDPLRRDHGAGDPALPARPRADPDALSERDRRPALLGEGGAQARTGLAGALALREPRTRRISTPTPSRTVSPRWPSWPTRRPSSCTPGPRAPRPPTDRPMRSSTSIRDPRRPGRRCSSWPGSIARRSGTSPCGAIPR